MDLDGENKSQCSHIISSEKWGSSLTILKSIYNHLFLDSSAVSMRLVYSGLNETYMLENPLGKDFKDLTLRVSYWLSLEKESEDSHLTDIC